MDIVVIDGQGGGVGRQLVSALRQACPTAKITAIGTNSAATTSMLRAGASCAATGENAVIVNSRRCDVIAGPIGLVIADALMGEITEKMAAAVSRSPAKRVLIPMSGCDHLVAGTGDRSMAELIQSAVELIAACETEKKT